MSDPACDQTVEGLRALTGACREQCDYHRAPCAYCRAIDAAILLVES